MSRALVFDNVITLLKFSILLFGSMCVKTIRACDRKFLENVVVRKLSELGKCNATVLTVPYCLHGLNNSCHVCMNTEQSWSSAS